MIASTYSADAAAIVTPALKFRRQKPRVTLSYVQTIEALRPGIVLQKLQNDIKTTIIPAAAERWTHLRLRLRSSRRLSDVIRLVRADACASRFYPCMDTRRRTVSNIQRYSESDLAPSRPDSSIRVNRRSDATK